MIADAERQGVARAVRVPSSVTDTSPPNAALLSLTERGGRDASLRVLHVVPSYWPATVYGGPIFSIHATCAALARQGVEVRVATTNANGTTRLLVNTVRPVEFAPTYRVRYYEDTVINRFSWAFTCGLPHDLAACDVVHLQDMFSAHAAWALMVAAGRRKPLLLSARGVLTPWGLTGKRPWAKKAWLSLLVRPFVRNPSRVMWHATAESERAEILARFPEARVVVIPNGIDLAPFKSVRQISRAEYLARYWAGCEVPSHPVRILAAMGRLHVKKAFDVAIGAFARLGRDHPDTVLLIAGSDDGDGERLRARAREWGLQRRVAFTGELTGDDKIAFLAGADLFLFPTHNENFGMAALEALAAGTPVVASREAPWSALDHRGSGRWVANTAEAFAAAAAALLHGDLASFRAAAKAHAAEFDLANVAASFRRAYWELMDGRRV